MANSKIIDSKVLQELTNKIQEIVNNYCWNLEEYTPEEIEQLFDGTSEEIDYYQSLIKDDTVSKNFLHSSYQVAEDISTAIVEANEYTDSLIKNISSIQLEFCETSLPTIGESTKIYILPVTNEGTIVNTLNIWNTSTNAYVIIGNLEIDLTQYYKKDEIDNLLELKADKDSVLTSNNIKTDITATDLTNGDLLGAKVVKDAIDSKANDSDVVKKTDITTTIDNNSTDEQIASARAVLRSKSAIRMDESVNPENYEVGAWFAEGNGSTFLSTSYGHPCSEWHIGYVVTGYKASDSTGYKIILAIAMSGNCYIKVQQWDKWTNWINIGTTSVTDVSQTLLTISDSKSSGNIRYEVKNGICYVSGQQFRRTEGTGDVNTIILCSGLPQCSDMIPSGQIMHYGNNVGNVWMQSNGTQLKIACPSDTGEYCIFSLSYPVAE